ncbi:GNAT family N-acetyltransferase [Flagellimonas sp. S3867]|uniref:GNAT family N-acetyltransferase n=1 Tax=Flagellimonas sp. S3867 TaxID=2768063 RepID=UPI001CC23B79|nr:GNAT family N-acetyltransferase [Flagellimonas sp. S3867]
MMNFIKTDITDTIQSFRARLYRSLKSPIDAMWELLYIASSQHYLISNNGVTIGYCCIDSEESLLQIYLKDEFRSNMNNVIQELITSKMIGSASLSTNEPMAFNSCLLNAKSQQANTFCFEHNNKAMEINSNRNVEAVTSNDIPTIKLFLKEQIGMDDTFGYTENLVSRKEIYLVKEEDIIVATSECRISDTQPDIADLGIIVNRSFQGKGIATQVLQQQVNRVLKLGRKPICSTTFDNKASQRAIEKAGFYCSNIIFDFSFTA